MTVLKALPEKVRCSDKEGPAVAFESRFVLAGERIKAISVQVVIVTGIERGARARRISDESLAGVVFLRPVKVEAEACEEESRKIIG